jgi:hypothetical protein
MTVIENIIKLASMQVYIGSFIDIVLLASTLLLLFYERNIFNIINYQNRYIFVDKAYWINALIPIVFVSL